MPLPVWASVSLLILAVLISGIIGFFFGSSSSFTLGIWGVSTLTLIVGAIVGWFSKLLKDLNPLIIESIKRHRDKKRSELRIKQDLELEQLICSDLKRDLATLNQNSLMLIEVCRHKSTYFHPPLTLIYNGRSIECHELAQVSEGNTRLKALKALYPKIQFHLADYAKKHKVKKPKPPDTQSKEDEE